MTNEALFAFIKKNPLSIGCGVLSVGLIAGIYFRGGELPVHEEEFAQKSGEEARFAANLQNAVQLKEQVDALVAANKEIESRLLHASQTLTNYQYFYKLESETGTKVTVTQGAVGPAAKNAAKEAFTPVPFSVTVQGAQGQLLDFLRRLESGAHYCRMISVSCSTGAADRSAAMTLTLNLELLGLR